MKLGLALFFLAASLSEAVGNFGNGTQINKNSEEAEARLSSGVSEVPKCEAETIVDLEYGNFEFKATPATKGGTVVRVPCPYAPLNTGATPISGKVRRREAEFAGGERTCYLMQDKSFGVWDAFHYINCRPKSMNDTIVRVRTTLANTPTFNAYNLKQLLPQLYSLFGHALRDFQSAELLVDTVNRVLETPDLFSDQDDIFLRGVRETMFNFLSDYTKYVTLESGQRIRVKASDLLLETAIFPEDTGGGLSYSFESFHFPSEVVEIGKSKRLKIQAFSENLFFHWGQEREWKGRNETVANGTSLPQFTSPWRVFSVEFDETEVVNLTSPVSYSFQLNGTKEFGWTCAYWDPKGLVWSTFGMRTLGGENWVRCESTHLTAFSVLIEPVPKEWVGGRNELVLSILSSLLSALSLAGLALTVLTYALFRKLRRERSNQILVHLSLSLLCVHGLSLSSSRSLWNSFCFTPAILLHYALLASFGWMLSYGLHLYRILVRVFVQPERRFILKRCLLAWGLPLLIVLLTAMIEPDVYREGRGELCVFGGQVSLGLYYGLYLGPLSLVMATNAFVFLRILLILLQQSSKRKMEMRGRDAVPSFLSPIQIRGTITLFILLGSGWILGLLAVGPFELFFRYATVLLNAGQGLLIFLFRVLLDPNAMTAWRRTVLSSESEVSLTTSSAQHRKGGGGPYTISPTFISSATNSAQSSITKGDPMASKLATSLFSILQSPDPQDTPQTQQAK